MVYDGTLSWRKAAMYLVVGRGLSYADGQFRYAGCVLPNRSWAGDPQMARVGLDDKDRLLLNALRQDSRVRMGALSKAVNLAVTPCKMRIKRLEKEGYIKGYTITEGKGVEVRSVKFMLIDVMTADKRVMDAVVSQLKKHKSVSMIFEIEGKFDYLVKIDEIVGDMTKDIIKDLRESGAVVDTNTFSVLEQILPD